MLILNPRWRDKNHSVKRAKFWKLISRSVLSRISSQPMNPRNITLWFQNSRRGSRISVVMEAIGDLESPLSWRSLDRLSPVERFIPYETSKRNQNQLRKPVINLKNEDEQCFKWCVMRALNPGDKNFERIKAPQKEVKNSQMGRHESQVWKAEHTDNNQCLWSRGKKIITSENQQIQTKKRIQLTIDSRW